MSENHIHHDIRLEVYPHDDLIDLNEVFRRTKAARLFKYPLMFSRIGGLYSPLMCFCKSQQEKIIQDKSESQTTGSGNEHDKTLPNLNTGNHCQRPAKLSSSPHESVTDVLVGHFFKKGRCTNSKCSKVIWTHGLLVHFFLASVFHLFVLVRNVRNAVQVSVYDSGFAFYLCDIVFQGYFTTQFVTGCYAHHKHILPLVNSWLEYEKNYDLQLPPRRFIKSGRACFFCNTAVLFTNAMAFVFGTIYYFNSMHGSTWPFQTNESASPYVTAFFAGVFTFFGYAPFFGAKNVRTTNGVALWAEYKHMYHRLRQVLADNRVTDEEKEQNFDDMLDQLQCINQLARKTYEVIKHHIAFTLAFSIPLYCFIIYGIGRGNLKWDQVFLMAYAGFLTTFAMLTTCFGCGELHRQARYVWEAPCNVSWRTFSPALLQKLNLFMSRLAVEELGFSVYGMFTVTHSTLLMVMGTIVTYGIIVIEFQLSEFEACPSVNRTH